MLGCGPGQNCCAECRAAGGGFAGYSNTERVLYDYVYSKLAAREPFYITPEISSEALMPEGGFGLAFMAAIAALAAKIGPAVIKTAEVAGAVKSISGTSSKGDQLSSQDIANAITPQVVANLNAQGIQLPQQVASQVTAASLTDVFGANTKPIMIAAGVALVALLLLRRR